MAKTAVINRNEKRRKTVKKFEAKRAALLAIINDFKQPEDERMAARLQMQQLPRNASPTRVRNRCKLTGRPRGVYSKFGLGRNKLRGGLGIGCKVTLRRAKMYEFLDRLVSIAIPRIRDFRGLSQRAFDGRGNYNLGVKEQIIFPEVEYDKIDALRGMNISITTTAKTDEEAKALLAAFKFPFKT